MDPSKVGRFIFELRKKNNLTQQQLADMLGVTYQAVSKWENGKNIPDIAILKDICKEFNVDINEVLNGEKLKKRKTVYIVSAVVLILIVALAVFLLLKHFNSKDFEFKTLSSNCSNFNISGSIAYNSKKSHIYISEIKYCGGDDTTKYAKIECILYETHGNIDTKIDSYSKPDNRKNMTLEEFLQDVTFHIDNYSATCKEFNHSNLFLQINATDDNNNINSYKILLDFEENCSVN